MKESHVQGTNPRDTEPGTNILRSFTRHSVISLGSSDDGREAQLDCHAMRTQQFQAEWF